MSYNDGEDFFILRISRVCFGKSKTENLIGKLRTYSKVKTIFFVCDINHLEKLSQLVMIDIFHDK